MVSTVQPRYEFRIFGNNLEKYETKINELSEKEMTRVMDSVYLLTPWKRKHNVKIREGVMDVKVLEHELDERGLKLSERDAVALVEALDAKSVVFPALGIESPVFERKKYSLDQFVNEVVCIDPDLAVAYVWKTRHAYTVNDCITEIAEIKVNGASVKTICVESEDPEKVLEAKKMIGFGKDMENVNYPLALKRIMGLTKLPDYWNKIDF